MTEANKKKFLVLYLVPASVMADWETDPATRRPAEQKLQAEWGNWMSRESLSLTPWSILRFRAFLLSGKRRLP